MENKQKFIEGSIQKRLQIATSFLLGGRKMKYEMEGKNLYIVLPEQFDHHNSIHLIEDTDCFLRQYQLKAMIFDFSFTKFMDSSGIGILLGRYKRMKFLGGEIYIENASERIYRMLEIAGLTTLIKEWKEN